MWWLVRQPLSRKLEPRLAFTCWRDLNPHLSARTFYEAARLRDFSVDERGHPEYFRVRRDTASCISDLACLYEVDDNQALIFEIGLKCVGNRPSTFDPEADGRRCLCGLRFYREALRKFGP